mmetsp:Transcript_43710/g.52857  ORF Transcript_43710/g.52857 Transcript_43710/m.52857 type:complete len:240 (+) Transcript_43710:424-1143(+)
MTALAMSSGSRTCVRLAPVPTSAPIVTPICSAASLSVLFMIRFVFTSPGWISVTLTPVPINSFRRPLDMAHTKCLEALYTVRLAQTSLPASLLIFTMCPVSRSVMLLITAPQPLTTPLQLTSMVFSHSSSCRFFMSVKYITPAQFTMISTGPKVSSVALTRALQSSRFTTSVETASAVPPAPSILVFTALRLSTLRAARATFAPSAARARAIPAPIPLEAPVTTATLPSNRPIFDTYDG